MKLIDILKEAVNKENTSSVVNILNNFKHKDKLRQTVNLYSVDQLEDAIDKGLVKKISSQTNIDSYNPLASINNFKNIAD